MIELAASTKMTLKMLEPTTFPMGISVLSLKLAKMFTNSYGVEVPNATIVNPITRSDTFILRAIDEAPFTRKSAHFISRINPTINRIKSRSNFIT